VGAEVGAALAASEDRRTAEGTVRDRLIATLPRVSGVAPPPPGPSQDTVGWPAQPRSPRTCIPTPTQPSFPIPAILNPIVNPVPPPATLAPKAEVQGLTTQRQALEREAAAQGERIASLESEGHRLAGVVAAEGGPGDWCGWQRHGLTPTLTHGWRMNRPTPF